MFLQFKKTKLTVSNGNLKKDSWWVFLLRRHGKILRRNILLLNGGRLYGFLIATQDVHSFCGWLLIKDCKPKTESWSGVLSRCYVLYAIKQMILTTICFFNVISLTKCGMASRRWWRSVNFQRCGTKLLKWWKSSNVTTPYGVYWTELYLLLLCTTSGKKEMKDCWRGVDKSKRSCKNAADKYESQEICSDI